MKVSGDYSDMLDRIRGHGPDWAESVLPPDTPGKQGDHWRIAYVGRGAATPESITFHSRL
jgi:hypothetical protein